MITINFSRFNLNFLAQSPRLGSTEHLVGSEERLRWEGERDRLLARIKELQVRNWSDNQGVF